MIMNVFAAKIKKKTEVHKFVDHKLVNLMIS